MHKSLYLDGFFMISETECYHIKVSQFFLAKTQWRKSIICKMPHMGLNSYIGATRTWRYLIQDEDHSGNGLNLLPGFLC